jgi:pilus assembly protein Flp/PilA
LSIPVNDLFEQASAWRRRRRAAISRKNCSFIYPLGADQFGSSKAKRCLDRGEGDFIRLLLKFLRDEKGATAIEYGLIAAGISLAIISIVNGMGTKLNTKFTSINSSLK